MTQASANAGGLSIIGPKKKIDPDLPFHDSLVHMFWHAVEGRPDNTAVIFRDRRISYREFGRAANGLARLLNGLSLEPGPIMLLMPNSIEMDVALMAVMTTGAQVAPVNPFFTVREILKMLKDFGATAIVCDVSTEDKAREAAAGLGIGNVVTVGTGGEASRILAKECDPELFDAFLTYASPPGAIYRFPTDGSGEPVRLTGDDEMAFDHRAMLDRALVALRRDLDDSPVAAPLLPEFSILSKRAGVSSIHSTTT